jgi:3-oxoadipate enol-lactonase
MRVVGGISHSEGRVDMRNILNLDINPVKTLSCARAAFLTAPSLVSSLAAKNISIYEIGFYVTIDCANSPPAALLDDLDRYLVVDGARIRYRDAGQGAVVLMVHGWTLDLDMWEPQAAALRDSFRIVRLDRRGFGLSSGRPAPAKDISDIGALCEHLGIRRVALVGMSQGVRAVLGFASVARDMISCLILDGPPDIGRQGPAAEDDLPLDYFRSLIRTEGISAFRREWAKHPLVSLSTADLRVRELLAAMIMRYPGNDLVHPAVTADLPPSAFAIDAMQVPMLVITGEHEMAQRTRAANDLAARAPRATRAVIGAAGHLPNLDNSMEYNAVLRAFLQRHASPFR